MVLGMDNTDSMNRHERLDQSNYAKQETYSIPLEPSFAYRGMTYLPAPRNELVLAYTRDTSNIIEFRRVDDDTCECVRSIELKEILLPIDDLIWCTRRNELLFSSDGQLFTFDLEHEQITHSLIIDLDKNKCRLACNSTLIACVDSRTLKLLDIDTLKMIRQKRLDHVCEDIEFDDQYFLSTHTGKLEFLDRTLFSIRRFAIGGTAICRFNSKFWLIADAFDDRLLWQSLDKLVLTINHLHQPKTIIIIPTISRIIIQCIDPNRLLIFDPIITDSPL